MTMTIISGGLSESHRAYASGAIQSDDTLPSNYTRYISGKGYTKLPAEFMPDRISARWNFYAGQWRLAELVVSGFRLTKAGKKGRSRDRIDYVGNAEIIDPDTPPEIIKWLDANAPTSTVRN